MYQLWIITILNIESVHVSNRTLQVAVLARRRVCAAQRWPAEREQQSGGGISTRAQSAIRSGGARGAGAAGPGPFSRK